jgi:glycosyltransferase involved in cell wall biosynthesis
MGIVETRSVYWASPRPSPNNSAAHVLATMSVVIGLEGLALGGCPINALDLGRALRERGHRVNVFAIDEKVRVSLLPYAENAGFAVTLLPTAAGIASRAQQIRRFAARHSADIIHVFAPWLGPAASIAAVSRHRRAPIVTNWMMENVSYTPRRTPMIVGTRMLQEEAELTHGSRVWLMEPPVDLGADHPDPERARRFRQDNGIGDSEIAAVIVSRLDSHMKAEGIRYTIRAIGQLGQSQLRLVIVGNGNAFDELQQEAELVNRELGRQAVTLTGTMHDPRPAYAGADVMLGMGGSALRTLAHGKPLIVLGEHGFARIFEPATVKYFYRFGFYGDEPSNDPVGNLAVQLDAVIAEDRRHALGDFGLTEVRARFGLDTSVEKLEAIYRDSLHAVPRPEIRWADATYLLARTFGHELRTAIARRLRRQR